MVEIVVGPIMRIIMDKCFDYVKEHVRRKTGMKKRLREKQSKIQAVVFAANQAQIIRNEEAAGIRRSSAGRNGRADVGIKRNRPTFIEDDSSSSTTEFFISPNGRFKKKIKSWIRGNRLGNGSFGTVYGGISDDGTFIAVKEVSLLDTGTNAQQCILQLEQEIALLSQFEHENIVQYYGTDKEESKLFIFLELATQGSIASLYQKYRLSEAQVSSYTRQILNGLNYLHERDVVHRDIKCANILVHANDFIKLADFGVAKEISKFNDLKSCRGSVYWMAPEVIHPEKTYGCAADIWSLGCTVLEMLTRQIPYPNMEWQQAAFKILRGDQPNIPSELSSDAQDFIRRCVHVDPNARPIAAQLLEHPFVTRRPLDLSQAQSLPTSFQDQDDDILLVLTIDDLLFDSELGRTV